MPDCLRLYFSGSDPSLWQCHPARPKDLHSMARDLDTASPAVETPPKLETMTATNNRRPNSNPIKRLKRWVKSLLFAGCEQLNTTSSWIQDRILHTTLEPVSY